MEQIQSFFQDNTGISRENSIKDQYLTKTYLDLFTYSAMGFCVGLGASIFFKKKQRIAVFSAGIGAGYTFQNNKKYYTFFQ